MPAIEKRIKNRKNRHACCVRGGCKTPHCMVYSFSILFLHYGKKINLVAGPPTLPGSNGTSLYCYVLCFFVLGLSWIIVSFHPSIHPSIPLSTCSFIHSIHSSVHRVSISWTREMAPPSLLIFISIFIFRGTFFDTFEGVPETAIQKAAFWSEHGGGWGVGPLVCPHVR